jgi:hypothetical protein
VPALVCFTRIRDARNRRACSASLGLAQLTFAPLGSACFAKLGFVALCKVVIGSASPALLGWARLRCLYFACFAKLRFVSFCCALFCNTTLRFACFAPFRFDSFAVLSLARPALLRRNLGEHPGDDQVDFPPDSRQFRKMLIFLIDPPKFLNRVLQ